MEMPDLIDWRARAPSVSNPVWLPVSTNTLAGGTSYFSDPQPANLFSRFYRLR